jgi:hypothetical protein
MARMNRVDSNDFKLLEVLIRKCPKLSDTPTITDLLWASVAAHRFSATNSLYLQQLEAHQLQPETPSEGTPSRE